MPVSIFLKIIVLHNHIADILHVAFPLVLLVFEELPYHKPYRESRSVAESTQKRGHFSGFGNLYLDGGLCMDLLALWSKAIELSPYEYKSTARTMILYPQNTNLLWMCTALVALIEFLRILVAYLINMPTSMKKSSLEVEKIKIQAELGTIKSVQLELVRASKLERGIIKIDKEIVKLKEGQDNTDKRIRTFLRGLRIAALLGGAIYFGTESIVQISPQVLWPFSFFSSSETIGLQPWFLMGVASLATRHLLRTLLPVFLPSASFP